MYMLRTLCCLLILALLLAGCAAPPAASPLEAANGQPADDAADEGILEDGAANANAPSDLRVGKRVLGRVESITGNEVTLELGETDAQSFPEGWTPPEGDGSQNGAEGGFSPDGRTPPEGFTPPEGGARDGMQRPEGTMPPGGFSPGSGEFPNGGYGQGGDRPSGGRPNVEISYTGEKGTYLIPVGLPVGQGDYSSITAGMILRLTLDEEDTVTGVMILSQ
jgi:hypothetical protein